MRSDATGFFTFDWDADVPDETRDRLFDGIARAVRRWRLEVPAALVLETVAPMGHLAGQALIALCPFVAPVLPGGLRDVQRVAKLLEKPDNVRLLIDRIADDKAAQDEGADAARE